MLALIHLRGLPVKESRAFAAVAHSINFFCAAHPRDERAPEQTLKIEREIGLQFASFFQPRPEPDWRAQSGEISSRKNMNVIHVRISAEQGRELWIHYPGDFRIGVRVANRGHGRQSVDNVAE